MNGVNTNSDTNISTNPVVGGGGPVATTTTGTGTNPPPDHEKFRLIKIRGAQPEGTVGPDLMNLAKAQNQKRKRRSGSGGAGGEGGGTMPSDMPIFPPGYVAPRYAYHYRV